MAATATHATTAAVGTTDQDIGRATNTQQAAPKGDIGGDWCELLDPVSGHLYYLHNSTGISQWTWPENVSSSISWKCDNILCNQIMETDINRCIVCSQDRQRKSWMCKECSKVNVLLAKNCTKCSAFPPGNWKCTNTGCKHINKEGPDLNHNEMCKKCFLVDRQGKKQSMFQFYMMAMDELQQQEWLEMREHNLQSGMSKNYCLARKDCAIRVQADLEKAPGPIARKVIAVGIGSSFCAMLSMFGVVFFFLLNYCVVQNVQMTIGKPVSNIENKACSGFTFTPPSQAALGIIQRQNSTNENCGNLNRLSIVGRSNSIENGCGIDSNVPSVFLLLQPKNGYISSSASSSSSSTTSSSNISDSHSHCWKATNVNNDILPYSVPPLILYATLLGIFVGVQELLNLAPAGHKCTKLGIKDRYCVNGCQCCSSKLKCPFSNIIGMLLGELFYYLTFVSGYNLTMNLFLTTGIDLSGYDQAHDSNPDYKGGGLWVSEIGGESSIPLLGLIASSFAFFMLAFVCKSKYVSRENWVDEIDRNRMIISQEGDESFAFISPCWCCFCTHQYLYYVSLLGLIIFYVWMSYTNLATQLGRLRFSSIVFPTLDFRLMHVDLTITMTIVCSVVLGCSRTISMCIKTWSGVASSAGAHMKSFATQSHIGLQKTQGKVNVEKLVGGAVKDKIKEEIENGAMDRKVLQEREEKKHHCKVYPTEQLL